MHMARGPLGLLVAALLGVAAGPCAAHAGLAGSDPDPGSRLEAPPRTLTLAFTGPVLAAHVSARDARGVELVRGTFVRPATPRRVSVRLARGAGRVRVTYAVVAADGHALDGRLAFHVAAAPGARASRAASASPDAPDVVSGAIVGGLLTLGALGLLAWTRRARTSPR
jgi:methionine-rich copper-binding protein CopC